MEAIRKLEQELSKSCKELEQTERKAAEDVSHN